MPEHNNKNNKNLGFHEISISFLILIVSGAFFFLVCLLLGSVNYAVPIWIGFSTITILIIPWICYKIKIWKKVAEFGKKLWYFPNLWYVVFLVGLYVTVIDVAQRVIGPRALFDVSIVLIATRNVVLAAFLAVITSVLAHTFWELSESTVKTDEALKKLNIMLQQLNAMTNKVENLEHNILNAINTLGAITELSKHTARVCELTRIVKEIASPPGTNLNPFREAVVDLSESIISYNKTALLPLLPPNMYTSSLKKESPEFPEFPKFLESLQSNKKQQQHCAYMAVATGRYLEAEALDRSFPGILLNVTSFVYYAQTAERVVNALQAWPDDFHFYTLMPKSPAELFRFSNTIDLKQWLGFLEYYNSFQKEKEKGKWIRYFAYAETSDNKWKKEYGYSCRNDLEKEIKTGYVKCEKGSNWKPQILSKEELQELITVDIVEGDRGDALIQNKIHDNHGTCVIVGYDINRNRISSWTKLEDAIKNLHVDEEHFRYRSMEKTEDIFDEDITIEISSERQCKITFPRDIVAVRRASIDAKPEDWVLLIGLDEHFINARDPQMGLTFSPVLDLCCMSQTGENNKKRAGEIRRSLQTIFLPEDKEGIFTHTEFKNRYINNNT